MENDPLSGSNKKFAGLTAVKKTSDADPTARTTGQPIILSKPKTCSRSEIR
jgi:hypothetical protein